MSTQPSATVALAVLSCVGLALALLARRRRPRSLTAARPPPPQAKAWPAATSVGSLGPNGLERLPNGNPLGAPCPSLSTTGRCKNRACCYSHDFLKTLPVCALVDAQSVPRAKSAAAKSAASRNARKSRYYVQKDAQGLLPVNLRLVDRFLSWECGRFLLGLGLFPDTKEISESMACMHAALERLGDAFGPSQTDTLAVCIGDGRTPRTAALLAMRTKWDCVSIDPALDGLIPTAGTEPSAAQHVGAGRVATGAVASVPTSTPRGPAATAPTTAAESASRLERIDAVARASHQGRRASSQPLPIPKELRHQNLMAQEGAEAARSQRARQRDGLASIARLRMLAARAEEAAVWVAPGISRVVVVLPHAHVTPDEALGCIRLEPRDSSEQQRGSRASRPPPAIAVIQLPCCAYVWHDHALGAPPDVETLDGRICASARTVRVWRDVAPRFNFGASALGLGARTARKHGSSERE